MAKIKAYVNVAVDAGDGCCERSHFASVIISYNTECILQCHSSMPQIYIVIQKLTRFQMHITVREFKMCANALLVYNMLC